MAELKNYREVGVFDLLSAPLNPIGAFDAEQFKKDVRELMEKNPDDKFVAVDLTGLDFVYSDAYNAFLQFQAELSGKGGMLALLSNSPTIMDGLRKAGLDSKLKVFAFEAEMMSFSLHGTETPAQEQDSDDPAPVKIVSQNAQSVSNAVREELHSERRSSNRRGLTKSFNAIPRDDKKLSKQGLPPVFAEEKSSGSTVMIIIMVLVVLGLIIGFIVMH